MSKEQPLGIVIAAAVVVKQTAALNSENCQVVESSDRPDGFGVVVS